MKKNILKEALHKLEAMRGKFDETDTESREKLNELIDHIHDRLDDTEDSGQDNTTIDKLKEAVVHFEVEHPVLTKLIEEIKLKLTSLGI